MRPRYYVRASCRDGSVRISDVFDSFQEALRWHTTVRQDRLVLVAVIVQLGADSPPQAPTP
jgi:hypothetical protein